MNNKEKNKEDLNKKKSFLRKMIDITNAKSLNMMILLLFGYIWYKIVSTTTYCFQKTCFLIFDNIFNILILLFFSILLYKFLKLVINEDNLSTEIRDLEKEKLQLEINKLKKKN